MKGLCQFLVFDMNRFLSGKTLVAVSVSDLVDYDSGKVIGAKVECAIIKDDTPYASNKDGSTINNLFEKMSVKIKYPNTVNVSVGDEVTLVNPVGTVYGDYSNKLSISAEGVEAIKHANKDKG